VAPILLIKTRIGKGADDVRFGSKAGMCNAPTHVRFTPNSDRKSGHPQAVMSASPPKADRCSAKRNVGYGPNASLRPARKTATSADPESSKSRNGDLQHLREMTLRSG